MSNELDFSVIKNAMDLQSSRMAKRDPVKDRLLYSLGGIFSEEENREDIKLSDTYFPAASLSRWMKIIELANIPAIKSEVIAEIDINSVLRSEEVYNRKGEVNKGKEALAKDLQKINIINENLKNNEMLRWDVCAPIEVKSKMAKENTLRKEMDNKNFHLFSGDPRAYDIIFEHPEHRLKIIKRPWVDALKENGMTVEFRVYIKDNNVQGVSNYYPQIELPESDEMLDWAKLSIEHSEAIVKECIKQNKFPFNNKSKGDKSVTASLDFLVSDKGELLFIEAGPGYGYGGHPCCFFDGESVSKIEGIKLSKNKPTLLLEELDKSNSL